MNEELILNEITEVKENLKRINDALWIGNGHGPLMSRVSTLENIVGSIKKILWMVVGAGVTLCVAYIGVNVFHVKI